MINKLNIELEQIRDTLSRAKEETEKYRRTNKYIESYRFDGEGAIDSYLEQFRREVQELLMSFALELKGKYQELEKLLKVCNHGVSIVEI